MYIDGHLDLAMNAHVLGYDLRQPLDTLHQNTPELLVSLPALQEGKVGIVFATLFVLSARAYSESLPTIPTYHDAEQAHQQALEQLHLYQRWEEAGHIRIIRNQAELATHQQQWQQDSITGLVILMEGADPIRQPEELEFWWREGVRMVGPAWQATRYAGGTHQPAGLSDSGKELILAMKERGMMLDISHLAEQSFWEALELAPTKVLASHSNARAITPTDRHVSDTMLEALAEKNAVIGIVMANSFLRADRSKQSPKESVTLQDVGKQAEHIARIVGWDSIAIGSDFDGGFGRPQVPKGIDSAVDFASFGEAVSEDARAGFLGANWLHFLQQNLPQS